MRTRSVGAIFSRRTSARDAEVLRLERFVGMEPRNTISESDLENLQPYVDTTRG